MADLGRLHEALGEGGCSYSGSTVGWRQRCTKYREGVKWGGIDTMG